MHINSCCNSWRQKCDQERSREIIKYKDLIIEIHRMLNVTAKVIPVILGATGTVSKSLRQYLSNVPAKGEIKELHKTVILGTAHKLREVLIMPNGTLQLP